MFVLAVSNLSRVGVEYCAEHVSKSCRIGVESVSNRSRLQIIFMCSIFTGAVCPALFSFCSKALLQEDKGSGPVFEKVCRSIIIDLFCMKLGTVWNEEPVSQQDLSAVISTTRSARVFKILSPYARTGVEDM